MRMKIFWSIAVESVWTWIIGGVFAVIGIIVFAAPNMGTSLNWPSLTRALPWYFWAEVGLFIWSIGFVWMATKRIYMEPPELFELSKIRTAGMDMRGKIETLKTKKDVDIFVDEYHTWEQKMLSLVRKLSPSSAETMAHIRNFPTLAYPHDVNSRQSLHRSILERKLTELENFLADYRGKLSTD